jgi:hypothetical protein
MWQGEEYAVKETALKRRRARFKKARILSCMLHFIKKDKSPLGCCQSARMSDGLATESSAHPRGCCIFALSHHKNTALVWIFPPFIEGKAAMLYFFKNNQFFTTILKESVVKSAVKIRFYSMAFSQAHRMSILFASCCRISSKGE